MENHGLQIAGTQMFQMQKNENMTTSKASFGSCQTDSATMEMALRYAASQINGNEQNCAIWWY
jgi:hypothetical protein